MQLSQSWLGVCVSLDISFAYNVEPGACAVLEDTIPADDFQVALAQVALRSASLRVIAQPYIHRFVNSPSCLLSFGTSLREKSGILFLPINYNSKTVNSVPDSNFALNCALHYP
jgi:hypothetical protein